MRPKRSDAEAVAWSYLTFCDSGWRLRGHAFAVFRHGLDGDNFLRRATVHNDIDIVVDLQELQVADFCCRFPEHEFYVSESAARDAVRNRSQFNIIHSSSGLKVDVIVAAVSPFNASRFARVRRVQAGDDFEASFASPEDAIVKKMDFYRLGGSEKHLRDITGILKTSREHLDVGYIVRWANNWGSAMYGLLSRIA